MNLDRNAPILVVDDFATMRQIIRKTLGEMGFKCISEAEDGQAAWTMLRKSDYALVICDWNMPGVTGIQLLKAVRSDDRLKDIPFLMLTAESKRDNVLDAIQAGVTNYIVKPFNRKTLEEKLGAVFGAKAA